MEPLEGDRIRITVKVVPRNVRWERLWRWLLAPSAESLSMDLCHLDEGQAGNRQTENSNADSGDNPPLD